MGDAALPMLAPVSTGGRAAPEPELAPAKRGKNQTVALFPHMIHNWT